MTRGIARLTPLALVVAAASLGASGAPIEALIGFALPAALGIVWRGRWGFSVPAQVLVLIAAGVVAMLVSQLARSGDADAGLRAIHLQLGLTALLVAGLRLHTDAPVWGTAGTLGAGLLVFLASGTVRTGAVYPTAVVVYAFLSLWALHLEAVARGERGGYDPRQRRAGALLLLLAAGLTTCLALTIPRLYHAAYALALGFVGDHPVSGFHDGPMRLGVLHGMLSSSEIVARVYGDAGEHLRGNVYVDYQNGRWLPAMGGAPTRLRARPMEAADPGALRARIVFSGAEADRFFVPGFAGRLYFEPERIEVDRMGVVRSGDGEPVRALGLASDGARAFPPAPPAPADLDVPSQIAAQLEVIAASWSPAGATAAERVLALRRRLEANNRYSLDQTESARIRSGDVDPVLAFLTDRRPGHCEYFASAMTLLARAAGLPARMVTGYRVDEINPWGGYAIVRERHAHAWSEVFVEGEGWVSVDPSPIAASVRTGLDQTPALAGLIDWAWVSVADHGTEALLLVLVVGLAGVQVRRILTARRSGPRPREQRGEGPPDHVARLLARLAASGVERRPSETLESVARRVGESGVPGLAEARPHLLRYAALRYGGRGDPNALRSEIEAWLRAASEPG